MCVSTDRVDHRELKLKWPAVFVMDRRKADGTADLHHHHHHHHNQCDQKNKHTLWSASKHLELLLQWSSDYSTLTKRQRIFCDSSSIIVNLSCLSVLLKPYVRHHLPSRSFRLLPWQHRSHLARTHTHTHTLVKTVLSAITSMYEKTASLMILTLLCLGRHVSACPGFIEQIWHGLAQKRWRFPGETTEEKLRRVDH